MPDERHGLNIIQVRDEELLLTCTAGDAIHLTGEVASGTAGRGAVLDDVLQDPGEEYPEQRDSYEKLKISYDLSELGEPRWAERTLCGREWIVMARSDGPPLGQYEPEAHAPTCRRCLSLMDRFFPEPKLDERFPVVAQVITDLVLEHGYAEIRGVPGDQQEALSSNVRSAVRRRAGCGSETFAHGDLVVSSASRSITCVPKNISRQRGKPWSASTTATRPVRRSTVANLVGHLGRRLARWRRFQYVRSSTATPGGMSIALH